MYANLNSLVIFTDHFNGVDSNWISIHSAESGNMDFVVVVVIGYTSFLTERRSISAV